jgi:hypothetical protein
MATHVDDDDGSLRRAIRRHERNVVVLHVVVMRVVMPVSVMSVVMVLVVVMPVMVILVVMAVIVVPVVVMVAGVAGHGRGRHAERDSGDCGQSDCEAFHGAISRM